MATAFPSHDETRAEMARLVEAAVKTADIAADDELIVRDPDDGSAVASLPQQDHRAVEAAVTAASTADVPLPLDERIRILEAVVGIVSAEFDVFAHVIMSEGVKTIREARAEVDRCIETLKLSAEAARTVAGQLIPVNSTRRLRAHTGYYRYRPLGVVAALTPYNDPLNLVAHKVGPSFAAGNHTILRPDERTPVSALLLCHAFWRAGTPLPQLQIVLGEGKTVVPPLVSDPRVRAITATGGQRLRREIERVAGARRILLELGGVSPAIVTRDADLALAATRLADAARGAAGQNCLHPQAVFVERPVHTEFLRLLSEQLEKTVSGPKADPATDMGPLIDTAAVSRVDALAADALDRGASPVYRGPEALSSLHRPLLVLRDVPGDARLWHEEVFGPVTATRPVDDLDQALALARGTSGLQTSVFTSRLDTAATAAAVLPHASVVVNDTDTRFDGMPFGGDGSAGLGREGPSFALRELSSVQSVHHNQPIERHLPR
ncbi:MULTISPECIES: aldehyde dehydrogenase family protein [Amycolatopsis]|uniref:Glyceraldehyde-3-phosphate dehydrogenase (NADP+) n=2 Tax=Amycolatopsis TaxID=1813 RepID=A0A1I4BMM7_9PSEU|nr:aldehyde dehydrogenase family protein [Amycolatopsis sacchari]SFK69239.1 glyceraldehyde-3-phosphate dehydrogenase (NADP+) [Amycolatopsis sacchari]